MSEFSDKLIEFSSFTNVDGLEDEYLVDTQPSTQLDPSTQPNTQTSTSSVAMEESRKTKRKLA